MSKWKKDGNGWAVKCGLIRIFITNSHIHNPGKWTMHGYGIGIDTHDLKLRKEVDTKIAKDAAIFLAQCRLNDMAADLEKIVEANAGDENDG